VIASVVVMKFVGILKYPKTILIIHAKENTVKRDMASLFGEKVFFSASILSFFDVVRIICITNTIVRGINV